MTGVSSTVLGKRKVAVAEVVDDPLVLHLTSSGSDVHTLSRSTNAGSSQQKPLISKGPVMIINGAIVEATKKRYCCTFKGCTKAYSKPSRLEEHERAHTGQRPFICETCGNSYLRETHLHAHSRSHLPTSARPFVCERDNCDKRFWTSQHLSTHHSWHDGGKPYKCTAEDCQEAFAKHHQLRAHICAEHAPSGTKPYRCEHEGCSKSFNTNQHLKTHQKTHDEKRYTCVHPSCLGNTGNCPPYFATWTSLQSHIRKAHPPTCTHLSCNGRTFANHSNLRAHLKLHEQHELDHSLNHMAELSEDLQPPLKRQRRGGEYGRDIKCEVTSCEKDFKSKKALDIHMKVTHLGSRDFVCQYENCPRSFGYKHLLQRHHAKDHHSTNSIPTTSREEMSCDQARDSDVTFDIDTITGNAYARRAEANIRKAKALRCPFPCMQDLVDDIDHPEPISLLTPPCDYVFSRSYDLRRHLKACHDVVVEKDIADDWVVKQKNLNRFDVMKHL